MFTIAIHTRHDANLTILDNDTQKIVLYLELEKITGKRYFAFSQDKNIFREEFLLYILPYVNKYIKKTKELIFCWVTKDQEEIILSFFGKKIKKMYFTHHLCHAWSSYAYTKPKNKDLILSYDGGGDLDDSFKIFKYENKNITLLKEFKINLGKPYRLLGLLSPELFDFEKEKRYRTDLPLAGKIMALAAFGKAKIKYESLIRDFVKNIDVVDLEFNLKKIINRIHTDKKQNQLCVKESRNLLATLQKYVEDTVRDNFYPEIKKNNTKRIICVGGCALNVTVNSMIYRDFMLPMFISPTPNDCGISIGAIIMFNKKSINTIKKPFSKNINILLENKTLSSDSKIKKISVTSIKKVSDLLQKGFVVATFLRDIEMGPRALGHRSLLGLGSISEMKNKMNKIKDREFWRPVAPVVRKEDQSIFFEDSPDSYFMSYAPLVKKDYLNKISSAVHKDGSARVQTVSSGFLYKLLTVLYQKKEIPILLNTSFNKKGNPLVFSFKEAIDIFVEEDIDYLITEKFIYEKNKK